MLIIQNAVKYIRTVFFLEISHNSLRASFLKLMLAAQINYSMEDAPKSLPHKATARHQNTANFRVLNICLVPK